MRAFRLSTAALALAVAAVAIAGCSSGRPNGAAREGLDVKLGGLKYNVYITRELNLRDSEDRGYYTGPEAPPGNALYGVFIRVCNDSDGFRTPAAPATAFSVEDNQGHVYKPLPTPKTDVFAYRPRRLSREACIPEPGSAADTAPTAGALLVFQFPVTTLENRPLEFVIHAPGHEKRVDLDI